MPSGITDMAELRRIYNQNLQPNVNHMKSVIDEWTTPPNSAATIQRKGKDDPLVDTGKMRDSVEYRIQGATR